MNADMKTLTRARRAFASILLSLTLLFATVLVATPPARAQGSKTVTAYSPSTTALKIVPADPTITSVIVVNNGSVTAYLGNTSTVTAAASASTDGLPLYGKNQVVFSGVVDSLYAITASGTADLRVTVIKGGGSVEMQRLQTSGISNGAAANHLPMSDGSNMAESNVVVESLTTAITPNSTTCSTPAGSLAITSNATGKGQFFRCDGTKYQLTATYADYAQAANLGTVATTGNTDDYILASYAATLVSADCSSTAALTANDTNYVTVTLTNLGQAGSGSTAMLAATAPNTTQATGGAGFAANTKRSLTVNGTGSNLVVAQGDRLLLRFAATGTLANTLTNVKCSLRFTRLS
jgi:hypothetical protein